MLLMRSCLLYSTLIVFFSIQTYLGGTGGYDAGWDIDVDQVGTVYISGQSMSTNFPTALTQPGGAYVEANQGGDDYVIYGLAGIQH